MRIGLFSDTYCPEINGVATSTHQLKKGLESLGHEVFVFAPDNKNITSDEKNVIRKYSIPFVLLKDRRFCIFRMKKSVKEIKKLNLDIVHSQTEFVMGHLARLSSKECGIPHIHTYHTVYEDYTHYLKIPGKNSKFIKDLVRKLSRIMCERSDSIVVPTKKVKSLLLSYKVKKDIFVQPTGIDYEKFSHPDMEKVKALKKKYGIENCKVLITIGRMSKEKNIIEIINFLSSIKEKEPDIKLVIVGEGPEKHNLEHSVDKLGLNNNVIFTGPVSWNEIENYYALGDIFVCGSTSETQGLTYIEALSSGKPILVRYDDCLKEVLLQYKNGIGYHNKNEFINGFMKIYNNYDSMVKECHITAEKYSNIAFAKNIENIYYSLTKKN